MTFIEYSPISREMAELVEKNVAQIFAMRGKVKNTKIVGNDDFGYSITVVMSELFPDSEYAVPLTPRMVEGVTVHVVLEGHQSPVEQFFTGNQAQVKGFSSGTK